MNNQLQQLYDWLDEPKQLTRQIIKDKITEIDKSAKPKTVIRFTPPTVQEILEYCTMRKNNIDAETFHDFYLAKDWFIGKNKMKNWEAAVRTWERNNINNPKQNTNGTREREPLFGRQTSNTVQSNASGWDSLG
ncbi:hypothetical protein [Flavobacterium sp.]|uniref:hypothetical protein n=1 Tax=Flavobacterium sp. TaxID=239 RepID=UPI00375378F1